MCFFVKLITRYSCDQLYLCKQLLSSSTHATIKYNVPCKDCTILFCDSTSKINILRAYNSFYIRAMASSSSGVYVPSTHSKQYSTKNRTEDRTEAEQDYAVDERDVRKKSEVAERKNVDSEGIPISLLGDGFTNRIHFLNKTKDEPQTCSTAEFLPIAVKSQLSGTPSMLLTRYPQLTQLVTTVAEKSDTKSKTIQYPFASFRSNLESLTKCANSKYNISEDNQRKASSLSDKEMQDNLLAAREELWKENCGTPDVSVPVSNIACGGCGALFHCKDPSLPGYMHSEKFKFCSKQRLKNELCQRCLYMQHFNIALNVSVNPEDYTKLISEIQHKKALVILIIDLTDFPCSLWPGIIDVIGSTKPLFVVGNKIDLLPCDHRGYLHHIVSSLKESLKIFGLDRNGNIRHVSLISAKTGYGIEELITKLHNVWGNEGDVYLIGCTNVGKSTLFNALLDSDFCKIQATDIVQRATISQWPGTTLNLLKFPILKMTGWRLYSRTQRLIKERKSKLDEQKLRKVMLNETNNSQYATLTGRIGMTFKVDDDKEKHISKRKPFDSNAKEFVYGHFCYDTPGTIFHDQILNLLTVEELMLTLPKNIIIPRTYKLSKFQTLFIAGLARVDLIESPQSILITVFSSHLLPIHMVYTEQSEKFYNHYLGTTMLAVPYGDPKRLQDFPSLIPKEIKIIGSGWKESCADVSLSSAGWISITLGNGEVCKMLVYTPEGRGCYIRKPPFLPFAVNLKGKRIRGTPVYENSKVSILQCDL